MGNEDEQTATGAWWFEPSTRSLTPLQPTQGTAEGQVPQTISDRYERREMLGRGGMSEVWRVYDTQLDRTVALKVLSRPLDPKTWLRFEEEARISAELQHPGVVPVHDVGRLEDGRFWFTMKEVRGDTLSNVLDALHGRPGSPWTRRRVLEGTLRVCETMAYAHSCGVVHRDLKPANVMFGAFGVVHVVDWGLAKVTAEAADGAVIGPVEPDLTMAGAVSGTPLYMSPEQARGLSHEVGPEADVYALGAILFHVLTGRPPRVAPDVLSLIESVAAGTPIPAPSAFASVEAGLDEVVMRALTTEPGDRYRSALELTEALSAWLNGAKRRESARRTVTEAERELTSARELWEQASSTREKGDELLRDVAPWEPEEAKAPGWELLDGSARLELEARRKEIEADRLLYSALQVAPDLDEAHVLLISRAMVGHASAETRRDPRDAIRHASAIEAHAAALPPAHAARLEAEDYLRGEGRLILTTRPEGAEVWLGREVLHNRRRIVVDEGLVGQTPLDIPLAMGSYVFRIRHPDCEEVLYPVEITRQSVWDATPPGASGPAPIPLSEKGSLGPDEVYVPPGWFRAGGDPRAASPRPARRVWCPGFVMQRHPTTNGQFLAFLNALIDAGRTEDALRFAPRERRPGPRDAGDIVFRRVGDHFELGVDSEGHEWHPDTPVVLVDRTCIHGYLDWRAEQTGRPWRLPFELEVEKAARGVDGRWFPWGDEADPAWFCMSQSHEGDRSPVSIHRFEVDSSVYGVRGVAGNVLSMCADSWITEGPRVEQDQIVRALPGPEARQFCARGGSWASAANRARCASRTRLEDHRATVLGFRGVYSYPL